MFDYVRLSSIKNVFDYVNSIAFPGYFADIIGRGRWKYDLRTTLFLKFKDNLMLLKYDFVTNNLLF